MKKVNIQVLATFMLVLSNSILNAQDDQAKLDLTVINDSADINVIATYPENVRNAVFDAASHPEIIVKIGDDQKKTNEQFKKLVSGYTKEEQQKIWNLTRYEGLIQRLSNDNVNTKDKVEDVLKSYPAEIHDDALNFAMNNRPLLKGIDAINKNFNLLFEQNIGAYPALTKNAISELLKTPEVLDILNGNMHMTVMLGDLYNNNPEMVKKRFYDLNLELAQQKAKDLEAWKAEMKNNPDAEKELQESSKEYAKEKGYNETEYRESNPEAIARTVYVSYPYWCGYPWWHGNAYWYPYPYWYHWGFYFWHGDIVWYGMPSWYFVHWHFNNHPHFYHYPHLSNLYINHYYYGPRRTYSRNTIEIHKWMRNNERSLPRDFQTNKIQRIERIREYGKSEIDRVKYNQSNPDKKITREEFMKRNSDQYPGLKVREDVKQQTVPVKREKNTDVKPIIRQDAPVKQKNKTIKTSPTKPVVDPRYDKKPDRIRKDNPENRRDREVAPKQVPVSPQKPGNGKAPIRK